jgi:hypothetical protein
MFGNIIIDKYYLNTNRIRKWEPNPAYDYKRVPFSSL